MTKADVIHFKSILPKPKSKKYVKFDRMVALEEKSEDHLSRPLMTLNGNIKFIMTVHPIVVEICQSVMKWGTGRQTDISIQSYTTSFASNQIYEKKSDLV